jgi:hypothetical protein
MVSSDSKQLSTQQGILAVRPQLVDSACSQKKQESEQDLLQSYTGSSESDEQVSKGNETHFLSTGSFANRRGASSKLREGNYECFSSAYQCSEDSYSTILQPTVGTTVRLSTTVDGHATVVSGSDQSLSPEKCPRSFTQDERSIAHDLHASKSAIPLKISRSSSGRSRDSRAWEFWCDSSARTFLVDKAEQEGSGSAADAIGLIRAHSQRQSNGSLKKTKSAKSFLSTNAKYNQLTTRNFENDLRGFQEVFKRIPLEKLSYASTVFTSPDSDKENQMPSSPSQQFSFAVRSTEIARLHTLERGEYCSNENEKCFDMECNVKFVAQCDENDQKHSKPVKDDGEELGCVEGLIKLSQSDWR